MTPAFKKAKRLKIRHRILLEGPTGSGKTLGALRLGYGLCGDWDKLFVIDTENDSALAYAGDSTYGIGEFNHASLTRPFTGPKYIAAMKAAVEAGAEVIVADSLSHVWMGKGGVLEAHDNMGGNGYTNWGKAAQPYDELIDYIVNVCPVDVIATARSKMKHALIETEVDGRKKTEVKRLGLEPQLRGGTEYEFLLVLEIERETHLGQIVTKRGSMLPDMSAVAVNEALGQKLRAWAESGEDFSPSEKWARALRAMGATKSHITTALGVDKVSDWIAAEPTRTVEDAISLVRAVVDDKKETA